MALRGVLRSWHGEAITRRAERAAQAAIDETLAACVAMAIPRAPIDTGFLRSSAFTRNARPAPGGVVGQWGFSAGYAAYVELGTVRMSARPFMRPAADAQYPLLPMRVRQHFGRLS